MCCARTKLVSYLLHSIINKKNVLEFTTHVPIRTLKLYISIKVNRLRTGKKFFTCIKLDRYILC